MRRNIPAGEASGKVAMDELKRIRTFLRVVESGSFSAAARDISSVSSVARQVQALEDELAARLLNRNSRGLSLTEAGQRLYESARSIVAQLDIAKSEVKSLQEDVTGTLRVSLRISAGITMVIPALPRFLDQYPDLNVDITLTDDRLDLIDNKIDVALWLGELPASDIVARRLCSTNRVVCCTQAYLEKHGVPEKPEDLRDHQGILYSASSYGTKWVFQKGDDTRVVDIRRKVRVNMGPVMLSLTLMSQGIAVLPMWQVGSYLRSGKLVKVLGAYTVKNTADHADMYAVYQSSRGLSRKIRVFVDFLVEIFKDAR
jgi:DNA-binding transcriptional LysR family regulator